MKHLFDMTIQVTEKEGHFIKKCIKKSSENFGKKLGQKQNNNRKKKVKSKQKHRKQTVKYGIRVKRGI